MMSRLFASALAVTLLVAGCQLPFGIARFPTSQAHQGSAELHLQADIQAGSFRVLASVSPYMPSDVTVLELRLFKLDGSTETSVKDAQGNPLTLSVPQASLSENVSFARLHPNTTYRVKAKAYADAGKTQLISTEDTRSQTDIAISQEDRPTLARIKVQLIDKPFDAQGSTGIDIASGSLVPSGSESITVTPRLPD